MLDLSLSFHDVPLTFLDVETTGLSAAWGDRVCEVAALRRDGGEIAGVLTHLVNPERPMGAGAFAVHGISDEMVREAPFFSQIAEHLLAFIDGAVFVGHNAPFDLGFLDAELARAGKDMPDLVAIDTLRLARSCYRLSSYSLSRVAQALGIPTDSRMHRALADVSLTQRVFDRLVKDLWLKGVRTIADCVAAQGGPLVYASRSIAPVPPLVERALRERRLLLLRYLAAGGQETERLVRPMTVFQRGGTSFLVAHCLLRCAQRTFRLDRILEMDLVEHLESEGTDR